LLYQVRSITLEAFIWLLLLARGIVNDTKKRLALLGNHEM
jgi:hypothetical protein